MNLECAGCERETPYHDLKSMDGVILCSACRAKEEQKRNANLFPDRLSAAIKGRNREVDK